MSHGNAFKKKKLRKEQDQLQLYTTALEDTDEQLKRDINKEFEVFLRNRILIDKLKKQNHGLLDQLNYASTEHVSRRPTVSSNLLVNQAAQSQARTSR